MVLVLSAPMAVGWSLLASLAISLAGVSVLVATTHFLPIQYLGETLAWSAAYLEGLGLGAEGFGDLNAYGYGGAAPAKDGAASLGKAQAQVRIAIHAFVLIFVWNVLGGGILLACQLASQLSNQWPLGVSSAARHLRGWVQLRLVPFRLASYLSGLSLLAGALDYCLRAARQSRQQQEREHASPLRRTFSWTDSVRHRLSLSFSLTGCQGWGAFKGAGAGAALEAHELDSLEDEFVSEADLRDFQRRVNAVELDKEAPAEKGTGAGARGAGLWTHLSHKESAHLKSHQWICSNAEDRLCGFQSKGLQMLVKTVFEGVSFEDTRAFYFDDNFRGNWDRCFMSSEKVLECSCKASRCKGLQGEGVAATGSAGDDADEGSAGSVDGGMCSRCGHVVRWVRKFPAFCGPREYIIARRSFYDAETDTAYVVSKSVDYDLPPKLKRVKEYYSSWRIRVVPSVQRPGETAVETVLLHYEDLGVPNSIFKLAMRTFFGWFISGLESNGLREYVKQRRGGSDTSSSASAKGGERGGKGARSQAKSRDHLKGKVASQRQGRDSPRWKVLALCASAFLATSLQKRHNQRRW